MKNWIRILTILSVLGIIISAFLTYSYYNPNTSGLCNISETISCEKISTSKYAVFFGVPVAILGIFFFLISLLLVTNLNKNPNSTAYLLTWNSIGIIFMAYLILAEFLVKSICLWCTAIHLIIIADFILMFKLHKKNN
jgi:uncharacterized membrane protein